MAWTSLLTIQPVTVCLMALVINALLCSGSRVATVFALPTRLAGRMIATLEERYNTAYTSDKARRGDSVSIAIFLVIVGVIAGGGLEYALALVPGGWALEAALLAMVITPRPLLEKLRILRRTLDTDPPEEARATVSLMTARDTEDADAVTLRRIVAESAATGMVQGIVSPLFWYVLGGLPLLAVAKLLDTASIMIDERSDNARSFGMAPRCLAALMLMPASWITAALFAFSAALHPRLCGTGAIREIIRRRRYAWPVFSPAVRGMAGALTCRLGGSVCIGSFHRPGDELGPAQDASGAVPHDAYRLLLTALGGLTIALSLLAVLSPGHLLPLI